MHDLDALVPYKSFDRVGYLMQHKNRSTTENYEGVVMKCADADDYFNIKPAA